MSKIPVSIVGGSGYTGGELIRLLLLHPEVEIKQITSESHAGEPISRLHPNLRRFNQLQFVPLSELQPCEALFLCLPHGKGIEKIDQFMEIGKRIIDLSADFRLKKPAGYKQWYGWEHPRPNLLERFVYGIPELHRSQMKETRYISSAGCNATASILALYPLYKNRLVDEERTVVEAKVGSSEGGRSSSDGSHHPERCHCVRAYKPTGHRHAAEMIQELSQDKPVQIHFSATAIELVRGIQATCHVFLKENLEEKDIWKLYRQQYGQEPFIRIVKDKTGNYRYPEPKLLWGTNFCDIGFEKDPFSKRLVVISAIDNLMKGAAGQAVQAFNIMLNLPEITGLEFPGLHPV